MSLASVTWCLQRSDIQFLTSTLRHQTRNPVGQSAQAANKGGVTIDLIHTGSAHEQTALYRRSKEGRSRFGYTVTLSASTLGLGTISALNLYQSCSQRISICEDSHEKASTVVGHNRHKMPLVSFEHCLVLEGRGQMVCTTFRAGLASRISPPFSPSCRNIASEASQPCKDGLHMLIRLLHRVVDRGLVTTLVVILIVCNGRDSHHRSTRAT